MMKKMMLICGLLVWDVFEIAAMDNQSPQTITQNFSDDDDSDEGFEDAREGDLVEKPVSL